MHTLKFQYQTHTHTAASYHSAVVSQLSERRKNIIHSNPNNNALQQQIKAGTQFGGRWKGGCFGKDGVSSSLRCATKRCVGCASMGGCAMGIGSWEDEAR